MADYKCPCCLSPIPSSTSPDLTCPKCGFRFSVEVNEGPSQPADSVGSPALTGLSSSGNNLQIEGYKNLSFLSKVGFGNVYKAQSVSDERTVVLKVLLPELSWNEPLVRRFEREARTLSALRHPGIVEVYHSGKTATGELFLVMEFVEGESLRKIIEGRRYPGIDRIRIGFAIARAVAHAHEHNVLHRDLTPEKVLVFEVQGVPRIKITDFGFATAAERSPDDQTVTREGMLIGSPLYMSPEQRLDPKHVDTRTDIYSFGVVFFELLTDQLPMGGRRPPSQVRPEAPVALDPVVLKMLEQDPSQRYSTMTEVVDAIRSAVGDSLEKVGQ